MRLPAATLALSDCVNASFFPKQSLPVEHGKALLCSISALVCRAITVVIIRIVKPVLRAEVETGNGKRYGQCQQNQLNVHINFLASLRLKGLRSRLITLYSEG